MKTSVVIRCVAIALVSSAPFMAHADDTSAVQGCMEVFGKQSFAAQSKTYRVERDYGRRPLSSTTGTRHVRLVANDRYSGRVLATAQCTVRNGVTTVDQNGNGEMLSANR